MKANTVTEAFYLILDGGSEFLKDQLDIPYLDALSQMGENVYQQKVIQELSTNNMEKLENMLNKLPNRDQISREEYRRAVQLAILKGMREATQPHHAMTPDAVSLFIGYLVNKLLSYDNESEMPILLDPAVGSGNLMTAVMNQVHKKTHFIGAEPDETLLKLAYVNANLQEHSVNLFHQDSIQSKSINDVDLVASDLPVGYYPNDHIAKRFVTSANEGHSFVHHLLIEQSLNQVKPGGFLVLLVPNHLFQSEQSEALHTLIKKEAIIYSLMQLPDSMFKKKESSKSILILRRKKQGISQPKQALLVELPSFSNDHALADMMKQISTWFDNYLKY